MKGLKFLLAALALTSLFAFSACDSSVPPFEDITWVMESYGESGSLQEALPDVEATLFFDSTGKEFEGNTGCNAYFGSYEVKGSKLSFTEGVAYTQIWCSEEIGQQEEEYVGMLSAADSLKIVDGKLRIICDGELIIYHKK